MKIGARQSWSSINMFCWWVKSNSRFLLFLFSILKVIVICLSTVNAKPYPHYNEFPEHRHKPAPQYETDDYIPEYRDRRLRGPGYRSLKYLEDYPDRDYPNLRNYGSNERNSGYNNDDIMADTLNPNISPFEVHTRIKQRTRRYGYYDPYNRYASNG